MESMECKSQVLHILEIIRRCGSWWEDDGNRDEFRTGRVCGFPQDPFISNGMEETRADNSFF